MIGYGDPNLVHVAHEFVQEVGVSVAGSPNEATLRHEIEMALAAACRRLGIPWVAVPLDRRVLWAEGDGGFVDVAHGAVVIEYEGPKSFGGREGARLLHAQRQAEEYAEALSREEGRTIGEYVLVAWDGEYIAFGRFVGASAVWEPLKPFDQVQAERILVCIAKDGRPLVHPHLLQSLVGPESAIGGALIPLFFDAIRTAEEAGGTSRTLLLFLEWRRLFGQVMGVQSERLQELLRQQAELHGRCYAEDIPAYLFALNTHIALVAKVVAALALPGPGQDLTNGLVSIKNRIDALESGVLFEQAGVKGMLVGDFFSWYTEFGCWRAVGVHVEFLLDALGAVNFDVSRKNPDSTRDLFKGMYESFVPAALRHALGEYYTPDWLADLALDRADWHSEEQLLDPTCGSGTFLLAGLRRRIAARGHGNPTARELVEGLYGIDLNPLAVIAARASLVVLLAPHLSPDDPIRIPVFLADVVNLPTEENGSYSHTIQTERGAVTFRVPTRLVAEPCFNDLFQRIRELICANIDAERVADVVHDEFGLVRLLGSRSPELDATIRSLVQLHQDGWDGIWCAILAERFSACGVPPVACVCGNPPWVKWSHLPREYAEFIRLPCQRMGVFSEDRWVGGIESDISTVITYRAVERWLQDGGRLAFFITGTVFRNESSQGFRRFKTADGTVCFKVLRVDDFKAVKPFENVDNFATLLLVRRGEETTYPVKYVRWAVGGGGRQVVRKFSSPEHFVATATSEDLLAAPVPGTDAGPWLVGTAEDHRVWQFLFGAQVAAFRARKGVTSDCNGIFFLRVGGGTGVTRRVRNNPALGRNRDIAAVESMVEAEHLFPLLRGRGVGKFSARPDPDYRYLVPQRRMHGDPDLPVTARQTHRYLSRFQDILERRGSYRRFQRGKPFWSLWNVGAYTFCPYKVFWQEMAGGRFVAAYCGPVTDPMLGERVVVPDHKVYFVPAVSEGEAAYLAAFLNAPVVSHAISSYASSLSLGVSVVEYLRIPAFDDSNGDHLRLAEIAKLISQGGLDPDSYDGELNSTVVRIMAVR